MRLLLFSDVHRDAASAYRLVELAKQVDVVVGAGDFATMRCGLEEIVDVLRTIDVPTVLVPGNSESYSELSAACLDWPAAKVLHGSGIHLQGEEFWGIGGAVPETPFGAWSYDFSEVDARSLLADCPQQAILVSHSPPKGILDVSSTGQSLGSVAVREVIDDKQPKLVVCGHIHESGGRSDQTQATSVVNAGPTGLIWDLKDSPGSDSA